ncbi:DUF6479 family protein [Streptomyces nodosus]|uniref:DUF6479 family protein n=1 Tax=Streptomyces nodosus TaxID=40318 RepID=UPI0036E5AA6F
MNTTTVHVLAAAGSKAGVLVIVLCGLVIAGALVWPVRKGSRMRREESVRAGRPGPGEHPTLPRSGPAHETRQAREPDEVPRAEGESERLTPHQLRHSASRRSGNQNRRRWESGSSGSFGSGGSGGG